MTLESLAQEFIVIDPSGGSMNEMSLVPLEVSESMEHGNFDHEHEHNHQEEHEESIEVDGGEPLELEIMLDLPGAPPGTKDPEPVIEVIEESDKKDEQKAEADPKTNDKWNWSAHGPTGFIAWVKSRCDDVPKHSGYDSAGIERAVAYLDRLDTEVSKAMRLDSDGELDANQIKKVRAVIDNGIERLQDRLDKVKSSKKKSRKKKGEFETGLVKEGQKITGVQGIFVTVPLLISRVARVCINGQVSAGHNIEDTFHDQVKKYKLTEREQAETIQLLDDMGYTIRWDRGYTQDETIDVTSVDNYDWMPNYQS